MSVGVSTKLLPAFSVSAHASKKAVVGFWDVSRRLFQSTYMISITAAKGEQSSPPERGAWTSTSAGAEPCDVRLAQPRGFSGWAAKSRARQLCSGVEYECSFVGERLGALLLPSSTGLSSSASSTAVNLKTAVLGRPARAAQLQYHMSPPPFLAD